MPFNPYKVSTHSRLKAAGNIKILTFVTVTVSTHSRLKAAGSVVSPPPDHNVGFNTQPPEGGWFTFDGVEATSAVSTHSRLKAAGIFCKCSIKSDTFQHTAA